ncbi:MAG: histidine phosphatase family protein [Betaproteobacteria bacterium]|nr:histidine phosphatase family protein [Betaproteobacteria bacterium]
MGTLYLVRHGQASFGADDYDRLSELGHRQCEALGQALRQRGLQPAAVLLGTLRRHQESWQALARGLGAPSVPTQAWPGLNEYDSLALLQAQGGEPLPPHDTPEGFKAHFRRLRQALLAWMDGRIQPQGMPSYADFRAAVVQALSHVQAHHVGQSVLLVSSGGPISTAVAHVLGAPAHTAIDLNMRLRNSSLTEMVVGPKRLELLAFNTLPHLEDEARRSWVSYA